MVSLYLALFRLAPLLIAGICLTGALFLFRWNDGVHRVFGDGVVTDVLDGLRKCLITGVDPDRELPKIWVLSTL